ncbi:putative orphan protein [Pseudoalteromonas translucida]|uniref:Orphan protein n=1 Tax=Pseudoalteromonas translucida (strain TAC 125) TaxID=326442 RepID=Q3IEL6_PSET1|nr:putative orphan protein [Pseudoalteromonas translucida]
MLKKVRSLKYWQLPQFIGTSIYITTLSEDTFPILARKRPYFMDLY